MDARRAPPGHGCPVWRVPALAPNLRAFDPQKSVFLWFALSTSKCIKRVEHGLTNFCRLLVHSQLTQKHDSRKFIAQ